MKIKFKIIFTTFCFVTLVHCMPIFSVNSVFETFDPSSMVRFFEFSDQGWNITEGCIKDMYLFLDGLQKDQPWAYKLFDASGYYSGGIYSGNDYRIGNHEFCTNLNKNIAVYYQIGNLIFFNNSLLPFNVRNVHAKYQMTVDGSAFKVNKIHQTLCMPMSCDVNDLLQILSYNTNNLLKINNITSNIQLIDVITLNQQYKYYEEFNFYVLIGIFTAAFTILTLATIFEANYIFERNLKIEHQRHDKNDVIVPTECRSSMLERVAKKRRSVKNCNSSKLNNNYNRKLHNPFTVGDKVQGGQIAVINAGTLSRDNRNPHNNTSDKKNNIAINTVDSIDSSISTNNNTLDSINSVCFNSTLGCTNSNDPNSVDAITSSHNSLIMQSAIDELTKINNLENDNSIKNINSDTSLVDSIMINNINTCKHIQNFAGAKGLTTKNNIPSSACTSLSVSTSFTADSISNNCHNDEMSEPDDYVYKIMENENFFKDLIREMSIKSTISELKGTNRSEDEMKCKSIFGLNVVCLLWVILSQIYVGFSYVSENKIFAKDVKVNSIVKFIFDNGSYAIDTFFFLCGISISLTFYKMTDKITIDKFCGFCEQILHFLILILNKFLKLILPYTVVLILVQLVMKHFNDYGIIEIPSMDHITCEDNMWKNVLYIDTFYPLIERCMPWSWFISLEVQFFVVACILMLLSKNHPKYSMTLCSSFFIGSFITCTLMKIENDLKENLMMTNNKGDSGAVNSNADNTANDTNLKGLEMDLAFFNGITDQPWVRIGPYLMGMCFGYVLHKKSSTFKISTILSLLVWTFIAALFFGIVYGSEYIQDTRIWIQASFVSSSHVMWIIILIWIIIASVSSKGGPIGWMLNLDMLYTLSKLTNCVYLIHPLILRIIILSSNNTIFMSYGTIVTLYLGIVILSYACGFILYVMFEAPISAFLRVLHHRTIKS